MSLHRLSESREEQVGQKTEWCSAAIGQTSGLGEFAGCDDSVGMRDSVEHRGGFSLIFLRLDCDWEHRMGYRLYGTILQNLSKTLGEMIWTAVEVQFGTAV